jgi:hypothetical protein
MRRLMRRYGRLICLEYTLREPQHGNETFSEAEDQHGHQLQF